MGEDGKFMKIDGRIVWVPDFIGQPVNNNAAVDFIIGEEGFLSKPTAIGDGKITLGSGLTDPKWVELYKARGNRWSAEDNRNAVAEEVQNRREWNEKNLPNWSRLSPSAQDALLSYRYNYNYTRNNSPKLFDALDNFNLFEAAKQMDATSGNSKFVKGLSDRRQREQDLFLSEYTSEPPIFDIKPEAAISTRADNKYPVQINNTRTTIGPYKNGYRLSASDERKANIKKAFEAKKTYDKAMKATSLQNTAIPQFVSTVSLFEKGGLLKPKDEWDKLSMAAKAEMMKVAVDNGIYNLKDIRQKYNEFAEGGSTDWSYDSWKSQIGKYLGINIDEDNGYDYEGYFRKYPEEAWKMLKGDSDAHFTDEFKTVYHPTFSSASLNNDGSIYSGVKHPVYNPQGLKGGTWSPDYKVFTMSTDGYKGPVSMDARKWYLENAEDNGVQLRESDGSLPVYDGIPWGGILPNVTIYGNKHFIGGPLVEAANEYKKGGGIHIAPSKKGTFTAAAKKHGMGVQQFASRVLAHPENYSPAMRKKANFARNAAKWHGLGGNLFAEAGQLGHSYYEYDDNGNLILGPDGKPLLTYNARTPLKEIVVTGRKNKGFLEEAVDK